MSQNGFMMNQWTQPQFNCGTGMMSVPQGGMSQYAPATPFSSVGNWGQPVANLLHSLGQKGMISWGNVPQPQHPQVQSTLNYLSSMVAPPLFTSAASAAPFMPSSGMPSTSWMYEIPVNVYPTSYSVPVLPSIIIPPGAVSASDTPVVEEPSLMQPMSQEGTLAVLLALLLQKRKRNVDNNKSDTKVNTTNSNDKVKNTGDNVSIDTKSGNDDVENSGNNCDIDTGAGNDTVTNSGQNNTIDTGAGNDTVTNTGNKNTIETGDGNDKINNDGDENRINTGNGDDHIVNTGDKNTIDAGAGNDTVENNGNQNVILGSADNDTLSNTGHQNKITGDAGNDTIVSSGNKNTLSGGAGNDAISVFNAQDNVVDGGDGNDAISVRNTQNSTISGGTGDDKITLVNENNKNVTIQGGAGTDTVVLHGGVSDYSQEIRDGNVRIFTNKTNQNAVTIGGDVEIIEFADGSQGAQTLNVSTSNTTLTTGDGNDSVSNAGDKNQISTGGGNDTVNNTGKENTIDTGAGHDTLNNSGDKNTLNTGDGNDKVTNNGHQNTIDTGAGNDEVLNRGNTNTIATGDGDDKVITHGNNNTVDTGTGDDQIINNAGEGNTFKTGAGDDHVQSNNGKKNLIETGDGSDQIEDIGGNNNTINAGAGDDSLSLTNSVNTHVNMGAGDDEVIINGLQNGPATISGGEGDDVVKLTGSISDYTVEMTNQGYTNYTSKADATKTIRIMDDVEHVEFAVEGNNGQSMVISVNNQTINTGDGVDNVTNNGTGNTINTTGGDDTVTNNGNGNTINTGAGNDTVNNNGHQNEIRTGDGHDTVTNRGNQNKIFTEGGDDTVTNFGNSNTLDGGIGHDTLTNNAGSDNCIIGGEGNDKLVNNGGHNNKLEGGNGADSLESINGNNNTLCGGPGNDKLIVDGGTGNVVNGGTGDNHITLRNTVGTKVESEGGNDTILMDGFQNKNVTICGGAGQDKVIFTGVASQYNVVTEPDGTRCVTHITSGNKTVVGKDVDCIEFTDKEQVINGVNAGGHGTIWGDPHFMDMNNSQRLHQVNFDIMGEQGKTYNLLSDKNIQLNGTFAPWGRNDITIVSEVGLRLNTADGEKRVRVTADGMLTINGQTFPKGRGEVSMTFLNGKGEPVAGVVKVLGNRLTIETDEYSIGGDLNNSHINLDVKVKAGGVLKDYVAPHGLLGQTADGDGIIRRGASGANAQGQGAIEGNYTQYEVSGLFATDDQFSRFGKEARYIADENDIDRDGNKVEAKALTIDNILTAIFDVATNMWRSVRRDNQGRYIVDVDTNGDKIADSTRIIDSNLYLNS